MIPRLDTVTGVFVFMTSDCKTSIDKDLILRSINSMSLYTSNNNIRRPLSYLGGLIWPKFPDAISGSFTGLEFGFITIAGTVDPNDFTS